MARDLEATARERVAAAGFRPIEPWPGTTGVPWLLECTECGNRYQRQPIPSMLNPCTHPEQRRLAAIAAKATKQAEDDARKAAKQARDNILRLMNDLASRKNLAPLEDYPGTELQQDGVLWWLACKHCRRTWHMAADRIRTCPHKGTGDPTDLPLPQHTSAHEAKLAAARRSAKKHREANK